MNTLVLLAVVSAWPLTPAAAAASAVTYFETLPEAVRNQTRLLMVPGEDVAERRKNAAALSYLVNSVARSRLIVVPKPVDAECAMIAIDLAAYANAEDPATYTELFEAWERLALEDRYWNLPTTVIGDDGQVKQVTVAGGWVDPKTAEQLRQLSGSYAAVLRADFFAAAVGERHYYRWVGMPDTEQAMLEQLGIDGDAFATLAAKPSANLLRSNVTRKPRRVLAFPGPLGAAFQTKDVDRETPENDPIRNPLNVGTQQFKFAATEWFAAGPNGLWRVSIFNGDGKLVDEVDPRIAKDHHDVAEGDGIIRPLWNCLRCHERGGAGGLQPFTDDQSFLLQQAGIGSDDPSVVQRITELYDPARLGKAMARAREDYADAVALATGGLLEPAAAVETLSELIVAYQDRPVSPETASQELCVEPESLAATLAGTSDPILLSLVHGRSVNRAAWESSYAEAALRAAKAGGSKP